MVADELTMKVRAGGRVVNAVVLIATSVHAGGRREVLGMRVATSGLEVLTRCRLTTITNTDTQIGADELPALSA